MTNSVNADIYGIFKQFLNSFNTSNTYDLTLIYNYSFFSNTVITAF